MIRRLTLALAALGIIAAAPASAAELNIYSARHYQTDDALYDAFTKETGIKVNRIEAKEEELLERIRNEGENSPADVFMTVSISRLANIEELGILAPLDSEIIKERIPAHLRGDTWASFTQRARVIVYNKERIKPEQVQTYASLADPALKGQVCTRSGMHPYNLSLGAAMLTHEGAEKTEAWAKGLVANFARAPKGGDTDQIKSVAAGECGVALTNSYYFARLMNSDKAEDQEVVEAVGFVWPDQAGHGTHINVSGAGILKGAKNAAEARTFLEYLTTDAAQQHFAGRNNEWPTVPTVKVDNAALEKLGAFKADEVSLSEVAKNVPEAQRVFDRAGFR